jgi:CheY-like chemotaxis protein
MKPDPLTRSIRPTVLLAEDDPDQSEMLSDTLEEEGYTVDSAFSGDAAHNKLLHNQYDLVILDIRMPGMDGATVLRHFRKNEQPSGKHIPVIVVSAFATRQDVERYKQYGADASFAKPYDMNELISAIANFVPPARVGGCDE